MQYMWSGNDENERTHGSCVVAVVEVPEVPKVLKIN